MADILVTGAAGFIGSQVVACFLGRSDHVVGVDNLNDYYDVQLKRDRLTPLLDFQEFEFLHLDIADREAVRRLFDDYGFKTVIHLAAQAGARYSRDHPDLFIDSNVVGFANVLEGCRHADVEHLVYASSSSVYGANTEIPFAVEQQVAHPVSVYGATKKANELLAHSYSHLFGIPTTGLRFFTVYGPWGRPDMAPHLFTRAILAGEPIRLFNQGQMRRDFTFIDDIVEGVMRVAALPPQPDPNWKSAPKAASSEAPYRVLNIGNHQPVELETFVSTLEDCIGNKAERELLPAQDGDLPVTYADVSQLEALTGFRPATPLADGLRQFVDWYRRYYDV